MMCTEDWKVVAETMNSFENLYWGHKVSRRVIFSHIYLQLDFCLQPHAGQ